MIKISPDVIARIETVFEHGEWRYNFDRGESVFVLYYENKKVGAFGFNNFNWEEEKNTFGGTNDFLVNHFLITDNERDVQNKIRELFEKIFGVLLSVVSINNIGIGYYHT